MEVNINVRLPDGTMFSGTALSIERAIEELGAIERKIAKLTKDNGADL